MSHDCMSQKAGEIAEWSADELKRRDYSRLLHPPRYSWIPMPRPWFWIFTFWRSIWKNYGRFEEVKHGTPEYETAYYELGALWHRPFAATNEVEPG